MSSHFRKAISLVLIVAFISSSLYLPQAQAGEMVVPLMPNPGIMVHLSPAYAPAYLKGIVIHPDNAFKFDFIVYKGDGHLDASQKQEEYTKLVKYFLAALTVPDHDQWVNLSPYEKNRIIQDDFGKTEMGRDLLTQDYLLKQITSSLIYPESALGKSFWDRVYERAYKEFGTTNIPVNTFNKVWILPDQAEIEETNNTAYIIKSHLKVMLEEDYLSLTKHNIPSHSVGRVREGGVHTVASQIIREIIIPELTQEVNEGKNFAMLRQVFSGMILAAWYKRALKESLLSKIYANKAKTQGLLHLSSPNALIGDPQYIYQQYLTAFKKGVYNYIKEETDQYSSQVIPRKYFSGGFTNDAAQIAHYIPVSDEAMAAKIMDDQYKLEDAMVNINPASDRAQIVERPSIDKIVRERNPTGIGEYLASASDPSDLSIRTGNLVSDINGYLQKHSLERLPIELTMDKVFPTPEYGQFDLLTMEKALKVMEEFRNLNKTFSTLEKKGSTDNPFDENLIIRGISEDPPSFGRYLNSAKNMEELDRLVSKVSNRIKLYVNTSSREASLELEAKLTMQQVFPADKYPTEEDFTLGKSAMENLINALRLTVRSRIETKKAPSIAVPPTPFSQNNGPKYASIRENLTVVLGLVLAVIVYGDIHMVDKNLYEWMTHNGQENVEQGTTEQYTDNLSPEQRSALMNEAEAFVNEYGASQPGITKDELDFTYARKRIKDLDMSKELGIDNIDQISEDELVDKLNDIIFNEDHFDFYKSIGTKDLQLPAVTDYLIRWGEENTWPRLSLSHQDHKEVTENLLRAMLIKGNKFSRPGLYVRFDQNMTIDQQNIIAAVLNYIYNPGFSLGGILYQIREGYLILNIEDDQKIDRGFPVEENRAGFRMEGNVLRIRLNRNLLSKDKLDMLIGEMVEVLAKAQDVLYRRNKNNVHIPSTFSVELGTMSTLNEWTNDNEFSNLKAAFKAHIQTLREKDKAMLAGEVRMAFELTPEDFETEWREYLDTEKLSSYPHLVKILERPENMLVRQALLDDRVLRPVFLEKVPQEGLGDLIIPDYKKGVIDQKVIGGEASLRDYMDQYSVFSIGGGNYVEELLIEQEELGQDQQLVQNMVVGVVDKKSDDSLLKNLPVANGRQAYFPLPDGTWMGVKGAGQFLDEAGTPYGRRQMKNPSRGFRVDGLAWDHEAENAIWGTSKLQGSGAHIVDFLGYRRINKLQEGTGYWSTIPPDGIIINGERMYPVLIFSRVKTPHRVIKIPQLLQTDPGLRKLQKKLKFNLDDWIPMIMRKIGETQAIKQNKALFKLTLHEQDITILGDESDSEESVGWQAYANFNGLQSATGFEGLLYKNKIDIDGLEAGIAFLFELEKHLKNNNLIKVSPEKDIEVLIKSYFSKLDKKYLLVWSPNKNKLSVPLPDFILSWLNSFFDEKHNFVSAGLKQRLADNIHQLAQEELQSRQDKGMVAHRSPGGIDMNSANMDLLIKRDGNGVALPLSLQDMDRLSRIKGFVPVIIAIKPVSSLPLYSEIK